MTVSGVEGRASSQAAGEVRRFWVVDVLEGRRAWVVAAAGSVLLLLLPMYESSSYWIQQGALIAVMTLVVSGVNVTFGYAGEVNFSQVFVFAGSAYLTMALAMRGWNDVLLLMAVGGVAAAIGGALLALPASRFGGWPLAIFTFFLVVTIPNIVGIFSNVTGGLNGLFGVPQPKLFGAQLGTTSIYEVSAIACFAWLAFLRNLMTSRYGVIFRNLRHSTVLTQSLGWSVWRLKMSAYILGSIPVGIAGCLFGYVSGIVSPASFDVTLSIGLLAGSILGGTESFYGAAIGALVVQLLPTESLSFAKYAPVGYGLFLVLAAVFLRSGIGGAGKYATAWFAKRLRGRSAGAVTTSIKSVVDTVVKERFFVPPADRSEVTVRGISKSFGGVQALDSVSLVAEPGRITGLMGANGSGKTTLLNTICGYIRPDRGTVTVGDRQILGFRPERIGAAGVGRTFQTPTIPAGVTVLDVVASGRYRARRPWMMACVLRLPSYRSNLAAEREAAHDLLALVGLDAAASDEASHLSVGSRRLVEVARALCGRPKVLLLDEPASGLSESEMELLAKLIRFVRDSGVAVVVIEHNYRFVRSVSDVVYVLQRGQVLAVGTADEIGRNQNVISEVLGRTPELSTSPVAEVRRPARVVAKKPILHVRDLEAGYGDIRVLAGVSLSVAPGTVEVILGRNGVGKTTLVSAIAGQVRITAGEVWFDGENMVSLPSYRRARRGIALVQEGKRIFAQRTVGQNLMLGTHVRRLNRNRQSKVCAAIFEQYPVLLERVKDRAGALSGGQQQMLAIGQALAADPKILLLDEPSAGLAPAIVDQVFAYIRELADTGIAVVLVEQKVEQALMIADHVSVLDGGVVALTGDPEEFEDMDALREAYFG